MIYNPSIHECPKDCKTCGKVPKDKIDCKEKFIEYCEKCPHVDCCNDKRMEACAFVKMPGNASIKHTAPVISMSTMPIATTHTPITINMGEYGTINTSMEEINEKIKKQFYGNAFNINCCFNKS